MSTAKLKVTVSCDGVKEVLFFRTSFFNNGIPLSNQFPIINRVFQRLVKPGYQVRVCRANVSRPVNGWYTLEEVFVWLHTVRLSKTIYENVITKPARIESKEHMFRMPDGIAVKEKWVVGYGKYEGMAFIRVDSKSNYLKPNMLELKAFLASKLGCNIGIGANYTLWISPYQMCVSNIQRFYGTTSDLIIITEVIDHPAEYRTVKRVVEL